MNEASLRDLADQVAKRPACPRGTPTSGRPAYRTLFELELRGVGRLAGGPGNILGKLTTTPLLNPPNGEILEIGTLFGLFSGGMARQMSRIGLKYELTIIDPFASVQLQVTELKPDASGSPVTETVVRENLTWPASTRSGCGCSRVSRRTRRSRPRPATGSTAWS